MTKILPLCVSAGALLIQQAAAVTTSLNAGSLGAAANGVNSNTVVVGEAGPLAAGGDVAARYVQTAGSNPSTGGNTTVAFNSSLNPISSAPFTIEFWAKPDTNVTDGSGPSPVFNRVTDGNRSGWVFFQRAQNEGWNFVMYNGSGSTAGHALTGGSYTPGQWTHVAAVWDGTNASIFVNGVNTGATNTVTAPNIGYNASTSAVFSVGSYDTARNPFNGAVDETAFYGTALSGAQLLAHYNAASSPVAGAYSSLVLADGARLYLNNAPEPATAGLALLGLGALAARRRSAVR